MSGSEVKVQIDMLTLFQKRRKLAGVLTVNASTRISSAWNCAFWRSKTEYKLAAQRQRVSSCA